MSDNPMGIAENDIQGVGQAEGVYLVSTIDHESASALEPVPAYESAQPLEESSCPYDVVCDDGFAVGQHELHLQ